MYQKQLLRSAPWLISVPFQKWVVWLLFHLDWFIVLMSVHLSYSIHKLFDQTFNVQFNIDMFVMMLSSLLFCQQSKIGSILSTKYENFEDQPYYLSLKLNGSMQVSFVWANLFEGVIPVSIKLLTILILLWKMSIDTRVKYFVKLRFNWI